MRQKATFRNAVCRKTQNKKGTYPGKSFRVWRKITNFAIDKAQP